MSDSAQQTTNGSAIITEAWKQKFIETNPIGKNYIHYPKIVQPQLEA